MGKITALEGQNLFDLAIQECGSVTSVFSLAELNGMSVTDSILPGAVLELPDVTDKPVSGYYRQHNLQPATDLELDPNGDFTWGGGWEDEGRIFDIEFPYEWE